MTIDEPGNKADVSPRALSVARMLDRLEPGRYTMEFIRPESPSERWMITVNRQVVVRTMNLSQRENTDSS